jgi:hypothetical protein
MDHKKPEHELREGGLKATIWKNREGPDTFHSVTFTRLYKDGEAWRQSHSFSLRNLERLLPLLLAVQEWMKGQGDAK